MADTASASEAPAHPLGALTAPGGPFEIVVEDVLGVPLQVYKNRLRSMRDLVRLADGRPEVDFLVQGDRRLTFGEHNVLVRGAAAGLVARGVARGDRVAVLSANTIEWVVLFWACAWVGAACVPLNAWWKSEELDFALRDSGAKVLVCDEKRWTMVRDLVPGLPELEQTFVVGLATPDGPARPFTELVARDEGAPDGGDTPLEEDDLLAILYTSGTTGRPKGATVTHRQALANLQNLACLNAAASAAGRAGPAVKGQAGTLLVVPLFHVTGALASTVPAYASGSKLVLMPPGRFDPEAAMATIERERITSIGGVPTIMWRIVESPGFGRYDLSSVARIGYGGAPAAPELVERIRQAFPNIRDSLSTAYGLTETASVATVNAGADYFSHPDSVGRPAPTIEVQIVGGDDQPVAQGETGEICLRGPTVMLRGYWNRPDATDAVFLPGGWFRTGDVGRLDTDDFLYLVDRAKDMIIRGGENVYCVEVENVLFEHPDVVDAAVVGVPHRELGEEVKAVVQLKPGAAADAEALRAYCRERLADFKVPEYVELRAEPLPRNPAGKILKSVLRGDAAASAFAPGAADDATL